MQKDAKVDRCIVGLFYKLVYYKFSAIIIFN